VKNKKSGLSDVIAGPNPFRTPVKHKGTPSPDFLIPPIKTNEPYPFQETRGISKAEKRLRGDSVSPSPQPRNKRPRTEALGDSDTAQPGVDFQSDANRKKSTSPTEGDSSFVDDSPVKQVVGRTFQPLFQENLAHSQPSGSSSQANMSRGRPFSRAKTMPGGLFGMIKKGHDNDLFRNGEPSRAHATLKGKGRATEAGNGNNGMSKAKKKMIPGPRGLVPEKGDLFRDKSPGPVASASTAKTFRKRGASKLSDNEEEPKELPSSNAWDLIPPSPPPQDMSRPFNFKGKGPSKTSFKRQLKKAKISLDKQEDDVQPGETSSGNSDIQIVSWRGKSPSLEQDDFKLEIDPELKLPLKMYESKNVTTSPQSESLIVELPDQIQRILALSNNDDREKEEGYLVKDLIRGQRRPIAEVWGPGEFGGESEGEGLLQEEDDWEGEGVPWEVGEL